MAGVGPRTGRRRGAGAAEGWGCGGETGWPARVPPCRAGWIREYAGRHLRLNARESPVPVSVGRRYRRPGPELQEGRNAGAQVYSVQFKSKSIHTVVITFPRSW